MSLGAQGVILGCTELPILISASDVDIPIFDIGKIHAHKAIEWSVNNKRLDYKNPKLKT